MNFDVVIIGAGAAGLFCAIEAGKRGRRVVVLEHNASVGRKIAISGGGRCNFTNINAKPENYLSANPHFCKSALARYTPQDFIALVKKHRIAFHEKKLGQLFCDGSARQIIQMLLDECTSAGVTIKLNSDIKEVIRLAEGSWRITSNHGPITAQSLVVACGGLSVPPIGASDLGYRLARQFGLKIIETRPALVPLSYGADAPEKLKTLSGIALDAQARCGKASFRENVLLTHRGLSGPAILQISSYWRAGQEIALDLLPMQDAAELLANNRTRKVELATFLSQFWPQRFAQTWCEIYAPSRPLAQIGAAELRRIAALIHDWRLTFHATEGYRKAEVTAGGVDTRQLSSATMAAREVPNLYFIGEVVDVTGWLGGYNFQWAWASGYAAGQHI